MITKKHLSRLFRVRPSAKSHPDVGYERLHRETLSLAESLLELVPERCDREAAIMHLRAALMVASAGLACGEEDE